MPDPGDDAEGVPWGPTHRCRRNRHGEDVEQSAGGLNHAAWLFYSRTVEAPEARRAPGAAEWKANVSPAAILSETKACPEGNSGIVEAPSFRYTASALGDACRFERWKCTYPLQPVTNGDLSMLILHA